MRKIDRRNEVVHGAPREYGSGSRQYRRGEPAQELFSSPAGGGQPYGGESYAWREGERRTPGAPPDWRSQAGFYREADDYYDDRSFAGERAYGEDYGRAGPWSGGFGRDLGPHRGRGPKNGGRSDARIREDVCERLSDDRDIDASDISVDVENGVVTLAGNIAQRRLKHAAEELAARCAGVKDVDNRLKVVRAD